MSDFTDGPTDRPKGPSAINDDTTDSTTRVRKRRRRTTRRDTDASLYPDDGPTDNETRSEFTKTRHPDPSNRRQIPSPGPDGVLVNLTHDTLTP